MCLPGQGCVPTVRPSSQRLHRPDWPRNRLQPADKAGETATGEQERTRPLLTAPAPPLGPGRLQANLRKTEAHVPSQVLPQWPQHRGRLVSTTARVNFHLRAGCVPSRLARRCPERQPQRPAQSPPDALAPLTHPPCCFSFCRSDSVKCFQFTWRFLLTSESPEVSAGLLP